MAVGVRECPLPTREKTAPNVGFLTVSQGHFNFGAFSIKITDYQNARSTERSVAHRTFGHCDFCDFSEDEAKLKLLYKTTGETAFRVALLRNNRRHPCTSTDFSQLKRECPRPFRDLVLDRWFLTFWQKNLKILTERSVIGSVHLYTLSRP